MEEDEDPQSSSSLSFAELRSRFAQQEQSLPASGSGSRVGWNPRVSDSRPSVGSKPKPYADYSRENSAPSSAIFGMRPKESKPQAFGARHSVSISSDTVASNVHTARPSKDTAQVNPRPPVPPKVKRPWCDAPGESVSPSHPCRSKPPPVPPKSTLPRHDLSTSEGDPPVIVDERTQYPFLQKQAATEIECGNSTFPLTDELACDLLVDPSSTPHSSQNLKACKEDMTLLRCDNFDLLSKDNLSDPVHEPDLLSPLKPLAYDSQLSTDAIEIPASPSSYSSSKNVQSPPENLSLSTSDIVHCPAAVRDNSPDSSHPAKCDIPAARRLVSEDSLPLLEHDSLDLEDLQTTPNSQATPLSAMDDSGECSATTSTSSSMEPFVYEKVNTDAFDNDDNDIDSTQLRHPPPYIHDAEYPLHEARSSMRLAIPSPPSTSHLRPGHTFVTQQLDLPEFREFRPVFYNDSLVATMCERIARVGRRRRRQDLGADGVCSEEQGDSLVRSLTFDSDDLCSCRQDPGGRYSSDSESSREAATHADREEDDDDDQNGYVCLSEDGSSEYRIAVSQSSSQQAFSPVGPGPLIGCHDDYLLHGDLESDIPVSSHDIELNIPPPDFEASNTRDDDEGEGAENGDTDGEDDIDIDIDDADAYGKYDNAGFPIHSDTDDVWGSQTHYTHDDIADSHNGNNYNLTFIPAHDVCKDPTEAGSDCETIADLTPPDGLIYGDEDDLGKNTAYIDGDMLEDELPGTHLAIGLTDAIDDLPEPNATSGNLFIQKTVNSPNPRSLSQDHSAESTISSDNLDNCSGDLSSSDCGFAPGPFGGSRPESMVGEIGSPPGSISSEYIASEMAGYSMGDKGRKTSYGVSSLSDDVSLSIELIGVESGTLPIVENSTESTDLLTPVRDDDFPSPPSPIANGFGFHYADDTHEEEGRVGVGDGSLKQGNSERISTGTPKGERHENSTLQDVGESCGLIPDGFVTQRTFSEHQEAGSTLQGDNCPVFEQSDGETSMTGAYRPAGGIHSKRDCIPPIRIDEAPEPNDPDNTFGDNQAANLNNAQGVHAVVHVTKEMGTSSHSSLEGVTVRDELTPLPSASTASTASAAAVAVSSDNINKTTTLRTGKAGKRKKKKPLRSVKRVSFRLRQDR